MREKLCPMNRFRTERLTYLAVFVLFSWVTVWGFRLLHSLYESEGNLKAALAVQAQSDEATQIIKMIEAKEMQKIRNSGKCSSPWVYEFPCVRERER